MRSLAAALAFSVVAPNVTVIDSAEAAARKYYVHATRGKDSASGTVTAPWRTIERANRVAAGSIVVVAAGKYHDAPSAPGVTFIGAEQPGEPERIITRTVELSGRGTRITGFTLAEGLDFEDGARDNVVERCLVQDHWGMWGDKTAAPRDNRIVHSRLDVREIAAHTHGDDRDRRAPRIVGPSLVDCDVTVRRTGGVLWRWSGVDDARITRTTIRLVNGGSNNDDDASWKWLYVRRAAISDSRIVLDHHDDFGGTGPFAPMWRDSTWGIRMLRTTVEAVRGNMIFSPNTAGTWICSCGGHRFEDVTIKAPGTLMLYQCPRHSSDTWVRSKVYAGTFEPYNTGKMPAGLSVRSSTAK